MPCWAKARFNEKQNTVPTVSINTIFFMLNSEMNRKLKPILLFAKSIGLKVFFGHFMLVLAWLQTIFLRILYVIELVLDFAAFSGCSWVPYAA